MAEEQKPISVTTSTTSSSIDERAKTAIQNFNSNKQNVHATTSVASIGASVEILSRNYLYGLYTVEPALKKEIKSGEVTLNDGFYISSEFIQAARLSFDDYYRNSFLAKEPPRVNLPECITKYRVDIIKFLKSAIDNQVITTETDTIQDSITQIKSSFLLLISKTTMNGNDMDALNKFFAAIKDEGDFNKILSELVPERGNINSIFCRIKLNAAIEKVNHDAINKKVQFNKFCNTVIKQFQESIKVQQIPEEISYKILGAFIYACEDEIFIQKKLQEFREYINKEHSSDHVLQEALAKLNREFEGKSAWFQDHEKLERYTFYNNQTEQKEDKLFSVKKIFALVWGALNDVEKMDAREKENCIAMLIVTIKEWAKMDLCPTGAGGNFIMVLNGTYAEISFVQVTEDAILTLMTRNYKDLFAAEKDEATKYKLFHGWVRLRTQEEDDLVNNKMAKILAPIDTNRELKVQIIDEIKKQLSGQGQILDDKSSEMVEQFVNSSASPPIPMNYNDEIKALSTFYDNLPGKDPLVGENCALRYWYDAFRNVKVLLERAQSFTEIKELKLFVELVLSCYPDQKQLRTQVIEKIRTEITQAKVLESLAKILSTFLKYDELYRMIQKYRAFSDDIGEDKVQGWSSKIEEFYKAYLDGKEVELQDDMIKSAIAQYDKLQKDDHTQFIENSIAKWKTTNDPKVRCQILKKLVDPEMKLKLRVSDAALKALFLEKYFHADIVITTKELDNNTIEAGTWYLIWQKDNKQIVYRDDAEVRSQKLTKENIEELEKLAGFEQLLEKTVSLITSNSNNGLFRLFQKILRRNDGYQILPNASILKVILCALTTSPKYATPLFYNCLSIILEFIKANFNRPIQGGLTQQLKESSYPTALLEQIDLWKYIYEKTHDLKTNNVVSDALTILIPMNLDGIDEKDWKKMHPAVWYNMVPLQMIMQFLPTMPDKELEEWLSEQYYNNIYYFTKEIGDEEISNDKRENDLTCFQSLFSHDNIAKEEFIKMLSAIKLEEVTNVHFYYLTLLQQEAKFVDKFVNKFKSLQGDAKEKLGTFLIEVLKIDNLYYLLSSIDKILEKLQLEQDRKIVMGQVFQYLLEHFSIHTPGIIASLILALKLSNIPKNDKDLKNYLEILFEITKKCLTFRNQLDFIYDFINNDGYDIGSLGFSFIAQLINEATTPQPISAANTTNFRDDVELIIRFAGQSRISAGIYSRLDPQAKDIYVKLTCSDDRELTFIRQIGKGGSLEYMREDVCIFLAGIIDSTPENQIIIKNSTTSTTNAVATSIDSNRINRNDFVKSIVKIIHECYKKEDLEHVIIATIYEHLKPKTKGILVGEYSITSFKEQIPLDYVPSIDEIFTSTDKIVKLLKDKTMFYFEFFTYFLVTHTEPDIIKNIVITIKNGITIPLQHQVIAKMYQCLEPEIGISLINAYLDASMKIVDVSGIFKSIEHGSQKRAEFLAIQRVLEIYIGSALKIGTIHRSDSESPRGEAYLNLTKFLMEPTNANNRSLFLKKLFFNESNLSLKLYFLSSSLFSLFASDDGESNSVRKVDFISEIFKILQDRPEIKNRFVCSIWQSIKSSPKNYLKTSYEMACNNRSVRATLNQFLELLLRNSGLQFFVADDHPAPAYFKGFTSVQAQTYFFIDCYQCLTPPDRRDLIEVVLGSDWDKLPTCFLWDKKLPYSSAKLKERISQFYEYFEDDKLRKTWLEDCFKVLKSYDKWNETDIKEIFQKLKRPENKAKFINDLCMLAERDIQKQNSCKRLVFEYFKNEISVESKVTFTITILGCNAYNNSQLVSLILKEVIKPDEVIDFVMRIYVKLQKELIGFAKFAVCFCGSKIELPMVNWFIETFWGEVCEKDRATFFYNVYRNIGDPHLRDYVKNIILGLLNKNYSNGEAYNKLRGALNETTSTTPVKQDAQARLTTSSTTTVTSPGVIICSQSTLFKPASTLKEQSPEELVDQPNLPQSNR